MKYGIHILIPCLLALAACNVNENKAEVTAPGAPANVLAGVGNGKVTVTWLPPVSNGGGVILGYTVRAVEDTLKTCMTIETEYSCIVSGLQNGASYSFVVRAFNSKDTSIFSSPSIAVTPFVPIYQEWTTRAISLPGIFSVAANDSLWVATGNGILTSKNLVDWTQRESWTANDVVWTGIRFIAVGGGYNKRYNQGGGTFSVGYRNIGYSMNGKDWTNLPIYNDMIYGSPPLRAVAWRGIEGADGQMVAVGDGGVILTSANGVDWTTQSSGISVNLVSVVWAGNQWVAVGGLDMVLTSPNGVQWTQHAQCNEVFNAITWTGSRLVAVGNSGAVCVSQDATEWSRYVADPYTRLYAVQWTGNHLVAAGQNGVILTSSTGENWTSQTSASPVIDLFAIGVRHDTVVVAGSGTVLTSP